MPFFKIRSAGQKGADEPTPRRGPAESVEVLRRRARHRLIGAALLVLVGIVGFPLLFDTQPRPIPVDIPIEIPDKNKVKPLALPSEAAALPSFLPGVSWSDHRSFWDVGVPAFMVTDTAPFRDPQYHLASDTPERLDYERMARLVTGMAAVVTSLAGER